MVFRMATSFSSPVLNTVVHPLVTCVCGNTVHDPDCPISGRCPQCGLTITTCRLLNECKWKLYAHPKRISADQERTSYRITEYFSKCDFYGNSLARFDLQNLLPRHVMKRIAELNSQYWEIKRWIPYDVGQLKQIELVLAKLRRLYIEVRASRPALPAQSALPTVPVLLTVPTLPTLPFLPTVPTLPFLPTMSALPAQSAKPAKRSQKAKKAGIAKPAQPAQPTGN
jgi:hypothetical protein